jgi:hypothetical protein
VASVRDERGLGVRYRACVGEFAGPEPPVGDFFSKPPSITRHPPTLSSRAHRSSFRKIKFEDATDIASTELE